MMASVNLVNGGLADYLDPAMLLLVTGVGFVIVMLVSWQGVTLRRIYTRGLQASTVGAAD